MVGLRLVHRQRQVRVDFAKKKPGTGFTIQHQRVLAAPAYAGFRGEFDFHDRCAVGEHAVLEWCHGGNTVAQLLQPPAQDLVVVASHRIAGHIRAAAVAHDLPAVGRLGRKIIHSDRNDPQRAWHQFRRPRATPAVGGQIVHVALPAPRQPFLQAFSGCVEVAIGDADLLETQFGGPIPNAVEQGGRARLNWQIGWPRWPHLDPDTRKSSLRVSPCFITKKRSGATPAFASASASLRGGSSSNSSVRRNVPQCMATA